MPFSYILVGLDLGASGSELTPGSEMAYSAARLMAKKFGARLVLFHSTARDEHWDPDNGSFVYRDHHPSSPEIAPLNDLLEKARAEGIEAELDISPEKSWLAITQKVLEGEIDLVVVGKRSHTMGHLRKIGSVSMKLLRKCPCPVLAVKDDLSHGLRNIVAATDLLQCGERIASLAVELARDWGGRARLVHAFQIPLDVQMEDTSDDYIRETCQSSLASMKEPLGTDAENQDLVTFHVGPYPPTQAVMAAADRFNADLVVMGSVGRGGVPGLLIGNTAERLLGRLDCSLLVVKPEDFISPIQRAGGS
jgi:universal stress protein E